MTTAHPVASILAVVVDKERALWFGGLIRTNPAAGSARQAPSPPARPACAARQCRGRRRGGLDHWAPCEPNRRQPVTPPSSSTTPTKG